MSDPEVHVKAAGRHNRIIDQRIIYPNILIHLGPYRDRLQQ